MNYQGEFPPLEYKFQPECYIANYQENPYSIQLNNVQPFYDDLPYNSSYYKIPVRRYIPGSQLIPDIIGIKNHKHNRSRSRSRPHVEKQRSRSRSRSKIHIIKRTRSPSRDKIPPNTIKQIDDIMRYPRQAIVAAYNKVSPDPVLCCYGKLCKKRFCTYSHLRPIHFICIKCPTPIQFVNFTETKKHMFIFHQFDDNKWKDYVNISVNPPSGKN